MSMDTIVQFPGARYRKSETTVQCERKTTLFMHIRKTTLIAHLVYPSGQTTARRGQTAKR